MQTLWYGSDRDTGQRTDELTALHGILQCVII